MDGLDSCAYITVGRICSRQMTGTHHILVDRRVMGNLELRPKEQYNVNTEFIDKPDG